VVIKEAKFIISNTQVDKCPAPTLPEYAFIGRSNVGKSTLINSLTNHKNLAKTSARPGKTQLINHFLVNDSWYLVDLPGYGWARVSKGERDKWTLMIKAYFRKRDNLACTFLLIDSRHEPLQVDIEFMQLLAAEQVAFVIVFTKADKQSPPKTQSSIAAYKRALKAYWEELPPIFVTSGADGQGREELLNFIDQTNRLYASQMAEDQGKS
jgi:GTP-binding protein